MCSLCLSFVWKEDCSLLAHIKKKKRINGMFSFRPNVLQDCGWKCWSSFRIWSTKVGFFGKPNFIKNIFSVYSYIFSIHDEELFACTFKAKSFFFHFYRNESTPIISIVLLAIFACISMILVIIVLLGYKIGWIRFNFPQRNKEDSRGNVITCIKHNQLIESYLELRFHTQ